MLEYNRKLIENQKKFAEQENNYSSSRNYVVALAFLLGLLLLVL
ncbi:MAG: hypothetical protein QW594_00565 [Candidatus Woesearchaeota archaeon]